MLARAGYGKSYIIHKLREMNPEQYVITSTMSNSARLINGQTIHHFISKYENKIKDSVFEGKTLIIDEVGFLDGNDF